MYLKTELRTVEPLNTNPGNQKHLWESTKRPNENFVDLSKNEYKT